MVVGRGFGRSLSTRKVHDIMIRRNVLDYGDGLMWNELHG